MKHHVAAPAPKLISGLAAALASAVLATACGLGSPPAAGGTPSPAPSGAGSGSTASPAASPVAPSACRLPVASGDAPTDGTPTHGSRGHGGFLQLPAGTFSADPASLGAYVLGARTWVPVPRAWVSPDGRSYAYPEYRTGGGPVAGIIHVVDIGSGSDHPLGVPAPSMPISWEAAGIYIARVVPNSGAPPSGLALLDPRSGALRQVAAGGSWTMIAGDLAVGADVDPAIAPPPGPGGPGTANRVNGLRLDSGAQSVLGTYPATSVQLLGAQGSTLLLGLATAGRYTVRLGSATLFDGPVTGQQPSGPALVDGSTVWMSGVGGVFRSKDGAPAERLAVPGGQLAIVAGSCR